MTSGAERGEGSGKAVSCSVPSISCRSQSPVNGEAAFLLSLRVAGRPGGGGKAARRRTASPALPASGDVPRVAARRMERSAMSWGMAACLLPWSARDASRPGAARTPPWGDGCGPQRVAELHPAAPASPKTDPGSPRAAGCPIAPSQSLAGLLPPLPLPSPGQAAFLPFLFFLLFPSCQRGQAKRGADQK